MSSAPPPRPVLEIGGTHVAAALVDPSTWAVLTSTRLDLDADASADAIIARFAAAAQALDAPADAVWGVAMPDPFDYASGVALFEGVGKFAALHGVDVGTVLRALLRAREIRFVNDADAFLLGEWRHGAAAGVGRAAAITLGTGIGSAWLVDGEVVDPGVPPGGRLHRLTIDGRPLEDTVSRRALRRAFAAAGGDPAADVREIAASARDGDERAGSVIDAAFRRLGEVVADCAARFDAEVLVVGGSMARSWDLLEPSFRAGARVPLPPVRTAVDSEHAPYVGAAVHAGRGGTGRDQAEAPVATLQ